MKREGKQGEERMTSAEYRREYAEAKGKVLEQSQPKRLKGPAPKRLKAA